MPLSKAKLTSVYSDLKICSEIIVYSGGKAVYLLVVVSVAVVGVVVSGVVVVVLKCKKVTKEYGRIAGLICLATVKSLDANFRNFPEDRGV